MTENAYSSRREKADYVWRRFHPLLQGKRVLDVGGGEGWLRERVAEDGEYVAVGIGDGCDLTLDLESGPLPYEGGGFDVVLCLDVLEHLESIHRTFDELCRVTRRHVILSLPNPWSAFFTSLREPDADRAGLMKFYGLPPEPPEDRHRWFFNSTEADAFVRARAARNGMSVREMAPEYVRGESRFRRVLRALFFRRDVDWTDLYAGPLWAVLETHGGSP